MARHEDKVLATTSQSRRVFMLRAEMSRSSLSIQMNDVPAQNS